MRKVGKFMMKGLMRMSINHNTATYVQWESLRNFDPSSSFREKYILLIHVRIAESNLVFLMVQQEQSRKFSLVLSQLIIRKVGVWSLWWGIAFTSLTSIISVRFLGIRKYTLLVNERKSWILKYVNSYVYVYGESTAY